MKLNELQPKAGSKQNRMRVGRGIGSGKGKTAGRGVKGQKSRTGVSINGFEGGQMPIYMRMPKRGFNNPFAKQFTTLTFRRLQEAIDAKLIDAKKPIDEAILKEAGVVRRVKKDGIRLLATGELKDKVTLTIASASKPAAEAIEKAGGKLTLTLKETPALEKGVKKDKKDKASRLEKKTAAKKTTKKAVK